MSIGLQITPPALDDASRIVALTAKDLREAHLTEEEVLAIANAAPNHEHVIEQQRRLELQPELYKVARLDMDVVGFIKTNEWFAGDQRPYATPLELAYLRKRDLLNGHHLKGSPLGIFALNVAKDADISGVDIAAELLNTALEGQETKEVRIGVRWNEPLRSLLEDEYGFMRTHKHGKQLAGIPSELYIRPPKEHSLQDH
jgi:hypothetical protein